MARWRVDAPLAEAEPEVPKTDVFLRGWRPTVEISCLKSGHVSQSEQGVVHCHMILNGWSFTISVALLLRLLVVLLT